ncbi:MAG: sensitivity to high expression protein she9 [Alyxoria varia]|nr:MAG: sensitivity to high expression protein she9 [Alyxoria varia]
MKALRHALHSRTALSQDACLALASSSRLSNRINELRARPAIASCTSCSSSSGSNLSRQPVRPELHARRALPHLRRIQRRHESTRATDSTQQRPPEGSHNHAGTLGQSAPSITPRTATAHSELQNSSSAQAEDTSSSIGKATDNITRTTDIVYTYISRLLHQLDTLTGTDYTPIKQLRSSIQSQEAYVSSLRAELASCRSDHSSRASAQGAHHKEVVGLLERKHSWSSSDLEHYMSLIRSEHLDEAAVVETRGRVEDAERRLEEARQALEKMERTRYHEEQVWSDTIRRQGTRVTVVLMGFNLLVLVASVALLEPHRRRIMVREITQEIKGMTDQKPVATSSIATSGINGVASIAEQSLVTAEEAPQVANESSLATELPNFTSMPHDETRGESSPLKDYLTDRQPPTLLKTLVDPTLFQVLALQVRLYIADLFSDHTVFLQRRDVTVTFMSGMGAGLFGGMMAWWIWLGWVRRLAIG